MKYTAPSFTVPASGKAPENCKHGWLTEKGRCVLCGYQVVQTFRADAATTEAKS